MDYTFTKLKEQFPKKTNRTERTKKKLHIDQYAETLVDIVFDIEDYDLHAVDSDYNMLADMLYEYDSSIFFGSTYYTKEGVSKISLMHTVCTLDFSEEYIKTYIENLICTISETNIEFAKVHKIDITYGDSYYGEW